MTPSATNLFPQAFEGLSINPTEKEERKNLIKNRRKNEIKKYIYIYIYTHIMKKKKKREKEKKMFMLSRYHISYHCFNTPI
jgi:hypothetical protein